MVDCVCAPAAGGPWSCSCWIVSPARKFSRDVRFPIDTTSTSLVDAVSWMPTFLATAILLPTVSMTVTVRLCGYSLAYTWYSLLDFGGRSTLAAHIGGTHGVSCSSWTSSVPTMCFPPLLASLTAIGVQAPGFAVLSKPTSTSMETAWHEVTRTKYRVSARG